MDELTHQEEMELARLVELEKKEKENSLPDLGINVGEDIAMDDKVGG